MDMFGVRMRYECPHCKHSMIRKGRWFYLSAHYTCRGCEREVVIPHDDKVKLIRKYAAKRTVSNRQQLDVTN
jgi:transposase-like protein